MTPEHTRAFNQAVQLAQSGQREAAYKQLYSLLPIYPDEPNLLLWYAFTTPDLDEAEKTIEKIAIIDSNNSSLQSARDWISKEKVKQTKTIATPNTTNAPKSHAIFSMVALKDKKLPDEKDFMRFLKRAYPNLPHLKNIEWKKDSITFVINDIVVNIALMSAPIPWSDLEGPCRTAWYWPEAATLLRRHVAHVLISSIAKTNVSILDRHILIMKLTAAITATSNSIGVYWGGGYVVNSSKDFIDQAQDKVGAFLPLNLWVNFQVVPSSKNVFVLRTVGMEALNQLEIEIEPAPLHPSQLLDIALGLATYLLTSGNTIADGDTIGRSATEFMKINYSFSRWEPTKKIMRITVT